MKKVCDFSICSGCGLCVLRCPKSCIKMLPGVLGHLYPHIEETLCIDCGLCQKGCPALNVLSSHYPDKAYAAWAKDSIDYNSSTSGALASVLSQYVIEKKGVVYGCAISPGANVNHIRVIDKDDLYRLKGSKYVQSSIINILPLLRNDVKNDRLTLFIGTPCQVAAVKSMYKVLPNNLYLVDLICHGVPSLAILHKHIRNKVGQENVTDVKFRNGNVICLQLLQNKKKLYECSLWDDRYKDIYLNTFIDGYTYRNSCHQCKYAKPERVSDITIGDFWGLGKIKPCTEIPVHDNGISVVLPNSERGKWLFIQVKDRLNVYERTVMEAINGNAQLRAPQKVDWRINCFNILSRVLGIDWSYRLINVDKIVKYWIKKIL